MSSLILDHQAHEFSLSDVPLEVLKAHALAELDPVSLTHFLSTTRSSYAFFDDDVTAFLLFCVSLFLYKSRFER